MIFESGSEDILCTTSARNSYKSCDFVTAVGGREAVEGREANYVTIVSESVPSNRASVVCMKPKLLSFEAKRLSFEAKRLLFSAKRLSFTAKRLSFRARRTVFSCSASFRTDATSSSMIGSSVRYVHTARQCLQSKGFF